MRRVTPELARQAADQINAAPWAPPGYRLFAAGLGDLEELVALGRACFDYNPPTRREMRYFLARAHAAVLALRGPDGALVGYLLAEFNLRRRSMYSNTICLSPAHRGRGLGHYWYRVRDAIATAAGCSGIYSHVSVDNAVNLHLALANGCEIFETIEGYYDNGKACHRLRRRLPPAERPA